MKNLYLFMALLLCAAGHTQNLQNAKWYFGEDAGLNFLPDPLNPVAIAPPVTSPNAYEGCASVSDQSGNLLFYSNSIFVQNKTHWQMTNGYGLMGNTSSTQGVVIVPRPGNPNKYFIATISGVTEGQQGLHYSEVDLTTGNGQVVASTKNTVLLDEDGIPIEPERYYNDSEKLTSTVHSDGINYWLVTYINSSIYSYLVTSAGISPTPVVSPAPLNIQFNDFIGRGVGEMKISPNTQYIALCYYNEDIFDGEWGAMVIGNFNYATGEATFDQPLVEIENDYNFYGLEFSPDSQIVYFTSMSAVYSENAKSSNVVKKQNIYNLYTAKSAQQKVPQLIWSRNIPENTETVSDMDFVFGLQLAINGKIYACDGAYIVNNSYISVINDPDNYAAPDFDYDTVYVQGYARMSLPQWVHFNEGTICPAFITLDEPETYSLLDYVYSDYIKTMDGYTVSLNQNINLQAGDYVAMFPETHIKSGSDFLALIAPCGEEAQQERQSVERQARATEKTQEGKLITLYPNPVHDRVNVIAHDNMVLIHLLSLQGKTLYTHKFEKPQNSHIIDVSGLSKGLYIVTIHTPDGKITSGKLAVN